MDQRLGNKSVRRYLQLAVTALNAAGLTPIAVPADMALLAVAQSPFIAAAFAALGALPRTLAAHVAFFPASLHVEYADAAAAKFPELAAERHASHVSPAGFVVVAVAVPVAVAVVVGAGVAAVVVAAGAPPVPFGFTPWCLSPVAVAGSAAGTAAGAAAAAVSAPSTCGSILVGATAAVGVVGGASAVGSSEGFMERAATITMPTTSSAPTLTSPMTSPFPPLFRGAMAGAAT